MIGRSQTSGSATMASRNALLTLANLLIPAAILVFATGFFPYKPFMPGLAEYEELSWLSQQGRSNGELQPPEAPFDKLVFMVVDALRSDFVYSEESGMTFVQRFVWLCIHWIVTDHTAALYAMVLHSHSQLMLPHPPSPCRA